MIAVKLIPRGIAVHADDGKVLAEVYDARLARLVPICDEMLAVCKMVVEAERQADEECNYKMLVDVFEMAERVIEKVEGEQ